VGWRTIALLCGFGGKKSECAGCKIGRYQRQQSDHCSGNEERKKKRKISVSTEKKRQHGGKNRHGSAIILQYREEPETGGRPSRGERAWERQKQ